MTRQLHPWSVRLREILADGEWHSREELIALAGPLIPPGRAIRIRETSASHSNSKQRGATHGLGDRPERSADFRLAVGRRRLIVDTLWQMGKLVERQKIDGVTYYRWAASPTQTTQTT